MLFCNLWIIFQNSFPAWHAFKASSFIPCLEAASPMPVFFKYPLWDLLRNQNLTQVYFSTVFRREGTEWADFFLYSSSSVRILLKLLDIWHSFVLSSSSLGQQFHLMSMSNLFGGHTTFTSNLIFFVHDDTWNVEEKLLIFSAETFRRYFIYFY